MAEIGSCALGVGEFDGKMVPSLFVRGDLISMLILLQGLYKEETLRSQ